MKEIDGDIDKKDRTAKVDNKLFNKFIKMENYERK